MTAETLLALEGVSKRFVRRLDFAQRLANALGARLAQETVHAVDGVDLAVRRGEVVGLVGESGCGKSTLGRIAVGLLEPSTGRRLWEGADVAAFPAARRREARLKAQMIFQDPHASLNPRRRVVDIVGEAPVAHGLVPARRREAFVEALLRRVGLDGASLRRFPHQFSGGQRARIGIARALAVRPDLLVCDEAVAALDVSVQAQVLNLFMDLRSDLGLTCLFISHDLGVVRHVSDRVAVMYLGRVVEEAPAGEIFSRARHPYTQALLAGIPRLEAGRRAFSPVRGEIPSPLHPPAGCHFHPRCPRAQPRCREERPVLARVAPGHRSACHLDGVA